MDWKQMLAVVVGGGLGSFFRWGIGQISFLQTQQNFPWPTFVVNMIGCFSIGYLYKMQEQGSLGNFLPLLLITGFLGGFTTFSAFGLELFKYLKPGMWMQATLYAGGSVVLGVAFVFVGYSCNK